MEHRRRREKKKTLFTKNLLKKSFISLGIKNNNNTIVKDINI